METEQLQNFNERLSEWVANQGFWFQIRYSMAGSGMKGRALFHLLRLGFRLLIFLAIVALGSWVYLVKRTDSERFHEVIRDDLKSALSASDTEMRGLQRVQGQFEMSRFAAEGGNGTFFTTLEARNIRCKMGLLDGLAGIWDPGIIAISKLDLDLRAGADDPESAHKVAEALFHKPAGVAVSAFDIANANLHWGFAVGNSERTQGAIEGSTMKMQRTETGWRIGFKGGLFRQNWLQGLQIVNLVVVCDPNGMVFETAQLRQANGVGTVDFSGLRVMGGDRPQVKGIAKIRSIQLEGILPPALRSFIEGSISGDFQVFGSTNTSDGIGFEGQVAMDGKDVVTLRERLHILKALSDMDYSRNYHRIDFNEGSFHMKTDRGGMELTDVKLKAEDLFTLDGKMTVRLPTQEEIQEAVANGTGLSDSPIFAGEDEAVDPVDRRPMKSDLSLKGAAQGANRIKDGTQGSDTASLFDRLASSIDTRRLQNQASDRMSRMLQYKGNFRITIPHDAFDIAGHLQQLYPIDSVTNRIPIDVPIEGNLYELTLKQAEYIYQQGKH